MPWEETPDNIRSGHVDPGRFDRFRTIDVSAAEGIKAVYGHVKGGGSQWEIQSYLFAKAKGWTMAKAKAWFASHKDSSLDALEVDAGKGKVRVTERWTSAPVTLTRAGVTKGWYKPPEAIDAMKDLAAPAIPLVIDHPDGTDEDPEIHDPDLIVGLVNELHVGESKGAPAYQGMAHIMNVPETAGYRKQLMAGKPQGVSIGYYLDRQLKEGEFEGQKYAGIESNIQPYHLGLMQEMSPACTVEDGCGVSVSCLLSPQSGTERGCCRGANRGSHGGLKLAEDEAAQNDGVMKLVKERDEQKVQLDSLAKKVKDLEAERDGITEKAKAIEARVPDLEKAAAELNALKEAARKARVDGLVAKSNGTVKAEDLKGASDAELDRLEKILGAEGNESVGAAGAGAGEWKNPDPNRLFGKPQYK